ncbi:TetR/AcrR family transcriptional regulator [Plantactinospora solaniradicis]|uniref:TetR/AcrR family transcriptional regulator n=1 Tax=Plantactinospora solaniradicis TaxID=1723736 RepID=A0ABW1K6B3_9ACTN
MARPAEPGRRALLDAGTALLGDPAGPSLAGMSVNAVVATAGMSKGAFYQHWPDRTAYLVALHRRFHDELQTLVTAAIRDLDPGLPRLTAALTAYLDGCLAAPQARALLFQARHDNALTAEVAARNAAFAAMVEPDLTAIGWQPPDPAASLLIAMAVHIAAVENTIGAPRRDLRETAAAFLRHGPDVGER